MRTHHLVVHLRSRSLTSIGRRRRRWSRTIVTFCHVFI